MNQSRGKEILRELLGEAFWQKVLQNGFVNDTLYQVPFRDSMISFVVEYRPMSNALIFRTGESLFREKTETLWFDLNQWKQPVELSVLNGESPMQLLKFLHQKGFDLENYRFNL